MQLYAAYCQAVWNLPVLEPPLYNEVPERDLLGYRDVSDTWGRKYYRQWTECDQGDSSTSV